MFSVGGQRDWRYKQARVRTLTSPSLANIRPHLIETVSKSAGSISIGLQSMQASALCYKHK